ncbi:hypothetical protein K474DRAFT_1664080 [Panus rudis PR-1116 ss-1]|nr:hypothetical protein K474DRAFT_1664080 [Panus rudis PR-1116 ss-1]
MCPLLIDWDTKVRHLRFRFKKALRSAQNQAKLAIFHSIAYEGVRDFVRLHVYKVSKSRRTSQWFRFVPEAWGPGA